VDSKHHSFNYIEIVATDLDLAKAFYGGAFGWTFKAYGPSYCGIQHAGAEIGGLTTQGERIGAMGPLVVLFSSDLDATLESVKAAGGTVVDGPYDFPGGRRFHFADPSGNELAVWTQT